MTYNIHHAEGLDGKIDLLRIAELIKREHMDIVALQEVDKGVERTARRDLPAELAELTGMTCVFSNNFHFQGGEYGNAILTRFPIKYSTNTLYKMLRPGEQRGLLQLILNVHGRDLVFMTTHIDHRPDDSERLINSDEIFAAADRYHFKPTLLCGDFNDTPNSSTYVKLNQKFDDGWAVVGHGDGFTFSADHPRKRIDYFWLSRNPALRPLNMWIPQSLASDHSPLALEFELR
jgi:endonuclease/exonuclease/phosphatase family metal-dependent hydrolase